MVEKTICSRCEKLRAIDNPTCSTCRSILRVRQQYKGVYGEVKVNAYDKKVNYKKKS